MKLHQRVRTVSVEQFAGAPYRSMVRGDLGAEVVKIKSSLIGGDPVAHPAKSELSLLANAIKIDGQRPNRVVCSQIGADDEAYVAGLAASQGAAFP